MKIKKGDKVRVIYGKDKGREGTVEKVYKKKKMVLVSGVNIYKKHMKKSEQFPQGGIVEVPRPLDVSKVMLVCPNCKKAVRVGFKIEKNKKYRICKSCGGII